MISNRNNDDNHLNRHQLTTKVDFATHNLVLEISSQTGRSVSSTVRDLIDRALEAIQQKQPSVFDSPKARIFWEIKLVRERDKIWGYLAVLKWEIDPDKFRKYCNDLGVDPADFDDVPPPEKNKSHEERSRSFLRVLFTDRPDGMLGTRVIEIAKQEGFGQNLIQRVANELGIRKVRKNHKGTNLSVWIPP